MELTLTPRVLTRRHDMLVLGPLGCFDRGDIVEVEGDRHVVVAIDHDYAGITKPARVLNLEMQETGKNRDEVMAGYAHIKTSYPPDFATERAVAGMAAQAERNRRELRA